MIYGYIALDDLDFMWSMEQVQEFDRLWIEGRNNKVHPKKLIEQLANYFDRHVDEIAILVLCRKRKHKI